MGEVLIALIVLIILFAIVIGVFKYRGLILAWLGKEGKRSPSTWESNDFYTSIIAGLSKEEAIKRIRDYKSNRDEIQEAITRPVEEEKK